MRGNGRSRFQCSSFPASRITNHPNLATRDQRPCSACIAVPSSEVPLASTADIQLPVRRMGTGGERHEFGGKLFPFKVGCQVSKPSRTSYIQYNTLRVFSGKRQAFPHGFALPSCRRVLYMRHGMWSMVTNAMYKHGTWYMLR